MAFRTARPDPSGQPIFRALTSGSGPQNLADQVRSRVGAVRPAFANVFIWNSGSRLSDLKTMLDLLGPGYVAVTPSQLYELYRQHNGGSGGSASGGPVVSNLDALTVLH